MSEQKPREVFEVVRDDRTGPYFCRTKEIAQSYIEDGDDDIIRYVEGSAFDKAVEHIKNSVCNCHETHWPDQIEKYICRRCKTLKDLGCANG